MRLKPWDDELANGRRGSGRSTIQLQSLEEGDVFISTMHRSYVRGLLAKLEKDPSRYAIVTAEHDAERRLMGLRHDRWIEVDHACYPHLLPPRLREFIQMHNSHHGVRTFG